MLRQSWMRQRWTRLVRLCPSPPLPLPVRVLPCQLRAALPSAPGFAALFTCIHTHLNECLADVNVIAMHIMLRGEC